LTTSDLVRQPAGDRHAPFIDRGHELGDLVVATSGVPCGEDETGAARLDLLDDAGRGPQEATRILLRSESHGVGSLEHRLRGVIAGNRDVNGGGQQVTLGAVRELDGRDRDTSRAGYRLERRCRVPVPTEVLGRRRDDAVPRQPRLFVPSW
jgi:hypothetical protein